MKNIWKIGLLLTVCAMLCITVATATDNNILPTKDDVSKFIDDMKGKSASEVMSSVKEDNPTWKADILQNGDAEAIALYYEDSSSSKGYGSFYIKDGNPISASSLSGYTVKESYKGELEISENNTEENTSTPTNDSTVIKNDETEKNSDTTYDSFTKALDKYDGKTDCTSMSCAEGLRDYFKGLGWTSEVKYCVAVDTSDEGTVYVVLGV